MKAALREPTQGGDEDFPKSSPKTEEQILEFIRTNVSITTGQLNEKIGISALNRRKKKIAVKLVRT